MVIDVMELASKAHRMNNPEDLGTKVLMNNMVPIHTSNRFNKERHEEAMRIATAPRNPKYWDEVNEISKKIINEVGVA